MEKEFNIFEYYCAQHLKQLMDINGRVTFSVPTGLAALMLAIITLNKDIKEIDFSGTGWWALTAFVGLLSLGLAIIIYSKFHSGKIRHFESRMARHNFATEEINLKPEDTDILPHWFSNYLIGGGLILLSLGIGMLT